MKWTNLKENKCPSCNKDWLGMGNATFHDNKIIECRCGFKITEKRMSEIIRSLVNKELPK